jgi:septal ring factor EnvC (AmiA/AmiB activator)
MSAPGDRPPDPYASDAYPVADSSPPPTPEHRRPWAWIAVCGVLALVVVGLAIWALNLNSDLDQQRDATAQAQKQADEANQQADQLSSDLDELGQSVSDAGDEISQAGSDAQETFQNALAEIKTKVSALVDEIKPPASAATPAETAAP